MGKYSTSWLADLDLQEIIRYGIKSYGLEQSRQYHSGLTKQFNLIANQPYLFQAVDYLELGCRRCVYRSHSIYYFIENDEVIILRILNRQEVTKALSSFRSNNFL